MKKFFNTTLLFIMLICTLCIVTGCRKEDFTDITGPASPTLSEDITPDEAASVKDTRGDTTAPEDATSSDEAVPAKDIPGDTTAPEDATPSDGAASVKDIPGDTTASKDATSSDEAVPPEAVPDEATPTPTPTPVKVKKVAFKGSLDIPSDIIDPIEKCEYLRKVLIDNTDYYDSLDNSAKDTWCFKRKKDHTQSGTYEFFAINDYNGYYVNKNVTDDDKVIYLTFDCGYPSDLTVQILDTLAAHNAKASFFVTKMYLKSCSKYALRMKEEGHMVCNHTVSHTDLKEKSVEKIAAEILDCAEYFYEVTGYEFDPFFRTPTGTYTKRLLSLIRDAGYTTVFWSMAYVDYDTKNQPAPGYVINHFTTYHHNGAIALMHNDSTSNVKELDAVLTMLEEQGYRFGLLDELITPLSDTP